MVAVAPQTSMLPSQDATALTLVESDSCRRTEHNFSDVKRLVHCTDALITAQQRVLVEQQKQMSQLYNGALALLIVSWLGLFCRGDGYGSHNADGYSHMDEEKPVCRTVAAYAAGKFLAPVVLTLSSIAIGIAIASHWALDTNFEMTQSVQSWMSTIHLDLEELDSVFNANSQDLVFANFSLLANDISDTIAMAVRNSWHSELPALPTLPTVQI